MFKAFSGTWIDGSFFMVLRHVEGLYGYFLEQGKVIAAICFVMGLGTGCVKMALGGSDLRRELTRMFMATLTYFMLVWLFPLGLRNLFVLMNRMAYDSIFSQPLKTAQYDPVGDHDSVRGFYEYLRSMGEQDPAVSSGGGPESSRSLWSMNGSREGDEYKSFLELSVVDWNTGMISLNKYFTMVLVMTAHLIESTVTKISIYNFFEWLPNILFMLASSFFYLIAACGIAVQYVMTVVRYAFLYGVGILLIPFLLWEGTKFVFERLAGAVFNIALRLLIVQICMYLIIMGNIDIMKQMYIISINPAGKTAAEGIRHISFYLTVFIMSSLYGILAREAPEIAEFLGAGQGRLGFGEFAPAPGPCRGPEPAAAAARGPGARPGIDRTPFFAGGVYAVFHQALGAGKFFGGAREELSSPEKPVFAASIGASLKGTPVFMPGAGPAGAAPSGVRAVAGAPGCPVPAEGPGKMLPALGGAGLEGEGAPPPLGEADGGRHMTEADRLMRSRNAFEWSRGIGGKHRGAGPGEASAPGGDGPAKVLRSGVGTYSNPGETEKSYGKQTNDASEKAGRR